MKMRICGILWLVLLAAALVALPGAAQARMWVGAQGGINLMANTDVDISVLGITATAKTVKYDNPTALGGIIIGYDFVKEGFLGYDYPWWMKYFSFAVDFTYNGFQIRPQIVDVSTPFGSFKFNTQPLGDINGNLAVLSFLFMAKYGFLPDSEVPFGRLQPYLAVGPGIAFSSIRISPFGSSSSADIAFIVEAGVRYMALKNVALDASFRYRYYEPSYDFNFGPIPFTLDSDNSSFTALFRVSYIF